MRITHGLPSPPAAPSAVTIGKFDGVHLGHQAMLASLSAAAARLGAESCVLTFEPYPQEVLLPTRPAPRLSSLRDKLRYFDAAGVDRMHVCRFSPRLVAMHAEQFIRDILVDGLNVRHVLVGDDFRFGAGRSGNEAVLRQAGERYGFEVVAMPSIVQDGMRVSSSAARAALENGDLALAEKLLGHPYHLSGRVVHGDKVGRQLGFPTANIRMPFKTPALNGVFVARLHGAGPAPVNGVASLGVRPTVKNDGRPTLEVHLFDFDADLYGAHVRLEFLHRLRPEEKYPSLDALIRQIRQDVADAQAWFAAHPDA